MKRIRFLFIGFNTDYVNPYLRIVLNSIGSIGQLEYFGPGYTTKDEMELGIFKWIENKKRFDFIVTDGTPMLSLEEYGNKMKNLFSMNSKKFETNDYYKFAYSFRDFFVNHSSKKILISNWDPYNINKKSIDYIAKANPFIIDFFGFEMSMPQAKIFKNQTPKSYNDNWYNYLKDNKKRTIVFPHAISSTEFDFSPIENRKNDFSVVGVSYSERKEASKLLSLRLKLKKLWSRSKMFLMIKLRLTASSNFLNNYKNNYFNLISESKLTYCSGSKLRYPVRKYFEIPSRGSVAVGMKCNGFDDLGFIDGNNYIVAESLDDLKEAMKISEEELQRVAINGRNLVWDKHSDWARREQLSKAIDLILNNKFKGSCWRKGEYIFEKK